MCLDKPLIETTGYIRKEEFLSTVGDNILQNTLVLESRVPFPGYHGANLPDRTQPNSLYFIVSNKYSFEEIARITQRVKEKFQHDFNACQGVIHFKSTNYSCIRIKHLKSFTLVPHLQNLYTEQNVKFAHIKNVNSNAIIKINKNFYVCEKEEFVYQDLKEESKLYIEIPKQVGWEMFKEITRDIKNNVDNNNFDAAQGIFFRKHGIVDVVRIYDNEKNDDRIREIRKMYVNKVKKSVFAV